MAVNSAHLDQDLKPDPVCGDTLPILYVVENIDGDPVDLSGLTAATFALRQRGSGFQLVKVLGDGVTVVNASAGEIFVLVPAGETETLEQAVYAHQLRLVIGGRLTTVAAGKAYFKDPAL